MIWSDAVCVACWWCRSYIHNNGLTGTLPTELGLMSAMEDMCAHLPTLCCIRVFILGYYCAGQLDVCLQG